MEVQHSRSIIGIDTSLKEIYALLHKVAPTNGTVLVTGESGTGKEVFVRALHESSLRKNKPFVAINCGAIPEGLLESTLFGYEKGAFTNAHRSSAGRFELADGGTIFLDEIGEMSLALQVKILRVLQEKEIERVGGSGPQKIDVRIVAATNKDLEEEVKAGRFREDLFYRINVISVHLPPLRERTEDIIPLCEFFLERFCKENRKPVPRLSQEAIRYLQLYPWNGNIRELENRMHFVSIIADSDVITVKDLPTKIRESVEQNTKAIYTDATISKEDMYPTHGFSQWPSLQDLEQNNMGLKEFLDTIESKLLQEAMDSANGVKNQAAERLRIKRTTLIEKLKKRDQLQLL